MFEKEAEEYKDNTRIKDENTYIGFPNERISELQDFEGNYIDISERIIKAFKDGAEFGYNKGYHDAEEHYMNVIDSQHKHVDESKNEAKSLLARWIDTRPYTVSEQKDLIADTEQFLSEVEK